MLSLVISRKLSWQFFNVWHAAADIKAHIQVFDWFHVPLHLEFVHDHLYRYKSHDFFCVLQPIQRFEQAVRDIRRLADAFQVPDEGPDLAINLT